MVSSTPATRDQYFAVTLLPTSVLSITDVSDMWYAQSDFSKQKMWDVLRDVPNTATHPMRNFVASQVAQLDHTTGYQIYVIMVDPIVTVDMLAEMFDASFDSTYAIVVREGISLIG